MTTTMVLVIMKVGNDEGSAEVETERVCAAGREEARCCEVEPVTLRWSHEPRTIRGVGGVGSEQLQ